MSVSWGEKQRENRGRGEKERIVIEVVCNPAQAGLTAVAGYHAEALIKNTACGKGSRSTWPGTKCIAFVAAAFLSLTLAIKSSSLGRGTVTACSQSAWLSLLLMESTPQGYQCV